MVLHSRVVHGWVYQVEVNLFGTNLSVTDDAIFLIVSQISSTRISRVVFCTICVEQDWTNFFICEISAGFILFHWYAFLLTC